jgi:hypothetical protein
MARRSGRRDACPLDRGAGWLPDLEVGLIGDVREGGAKLGRYGMVGVVAHDVSRMVSIEKEDDCLVAGPEVAAIDAPGERLLKAAHVHGAVAEFVAVCFGAEMKASKNGCGHLANPQVRANETIAIRGRRV